MVSIDAGSPLTFPAPFGREMSTEEVYIAEMDGKTGASLKHTLPNPNGRIWTLVAGGGASVVYELACTLKARFCSLEVALLIYQCKRVFFFKNLKQTALRSTHMLMTSNPGCLDVQG